MAEYPTLAPPSAKNEEVFYCPFGCKGNEIDGNGYCGHLVGFTTDMETIEPIVDLMRYDSAKGGWYATGHLAVVSSMREYLQPGDVKVNPIIKEKLPKEDLEYEKYLWVSFRVYSDDPNRIPNLCEREVPRGPRVKNKTFEFAHRKQVFEQQLNAPGPDADIEINPRKRLRKKAQDEAGKGKKLVSTAAANADSPAEGAATE